jgi:hypothetical protein
MNRRLLGVLFGAGGILMGLPPLAEEPVQASVEQLSWLSGCWELRDGVRRVEEQWMQPRGGMMLGMSRTVRDGATVEYEFLQIRKEGGRLVLTARPSGQAETSFSSVEAAGTKVVFENPAHDFPQRILYERRPDGSLHARIEGMRNNELRGVDFPMQRTGCPGSAM